MQNLLRIQARVRAFFRPPYRVGIRQQLVILVLAVALFSLIILAVITGIYFTNTYKSLRADRLYVAAQLKSSQMDQSLDYLYYQCYWVSEKSDYGDALVRRKAGNNSESNWVNSQVDLEKFLSSSNTFNYAVLYDASFDNMLSVSNNGTGDNIPTDVLDSLLPLSGTQPLPKSLLTEGMLTNPVLNSTDQYLMSMSLPIFSTASILLSSEELVGYLTIIMSADSLRSAYSDSTSLGETEVSFVAASYNDGVIDGYTFVFPPNGYLISVNTTFGNLNNSFLGDVFYDNKSGGSIRKTTFFYDSTVALGYSKCSFMFTTWVAVVTQAEHAFLAPATKLTKIIIGTVVGIACCIGLFTLPLAHWAAKPIVRLKQATETIAAGRGLKSNNYSSSDLHSYTDSSYNTQIELVDNTTGDISRRSTVYGHKKKSGNNSIISFARSFQFGHNKNNKSDAQNTMDDKYNNVNYKNQTKENEFDRISCHSNQEEKNSNTEKHKEFLDKKDLLAASNKRAIPRDLNMNLVMKSPSIDSPAHSRYDCSASEVSLPHSNPYSERRPDYLPHASSNLINARIPVYRRTFIDELSELTDTFNTMTDELDRYYTLLEDRVRARTKELEQAKLQAEAANEAKTVFIANISHELRTPLNGILGMTAIAMAEKDPDQIQNSLKLIFRSGELLLNILTELLTFSKNVLKRTKLEEREFLLQDIALQVKSIFGKLAKDQRVKLTITIDPNDARKKVLWGDSNRLIQIVMNLVSNALKFTPVDGKVSAKISLLGQYDAERSAAVNYNKVFVQEDRPDSSQNSFNDPFSDTGSGDILKDGEAGSPKHGSLKEKQGHEVESDEDDFADSSLSSITSSSASSYDDALFLSQFKKNDNPDSDEFDDYNAKIIPEDERTFWVFAIEVEDTGPGIEPSLQKAVFEPFVQGDQTLSRQYGGTGLGLSICRQLALMMKGTMGLESTVGKGSKFTFTVPLKQTRELVLNEEQCKFDDEFNAASRTRRKIRFKESSVRNSRKSSVVDELGSFSRKTVYSDSSSSRPNTLQRGSDNSIKTMSVKVDRPFLQSTGTAASSLKIHTLNSPDANSIRSSDVDPTDSVGHNNTVPKAVDVSNKGTNPAATSTTEKLVTNTVVAASNTEESNKKKEYRILVAEDNNVNQEVIRRMLNLQGFKNIVLACDGQDAVDKVKAMMDANAENANSEEGKYYDLIFMDVQMPRIDGLEATRIIRNELHYTKNIVALTAFADDSNIKECMDSGMNGFLSKPIKRPMLKKILEEYLINQD